VEKQLIPFGGLKPSSQWYSLTNTPSRGKTTNPLRGIETRLGVDAFSQECENRGKTTNPLRGIETELDVPGPHLLLERWKNN